MSDKIKRAAQALMAIAGTSNERIAEVEELISEMRDARTDPHHRLTSAASAVACDLHRELAPPLLPIAIRPILFIASNDMTARRAALEAHELAGRWAFVDFDVLPADVVTSQSKWNELSGVTIYIRDLSALVIETQICLAERLLEVQREDSPFVAARMTITPLVSLQAGKSLRTLIKAFCARTIPDAASGPAIELAVTEAVACARIKRPVERSRWTSVAEKRNASAFEPLYAVRTMAQDRVH